MEGTVNATVIDTLRLADRLKEAGFEAPRAEGMARALGDELADRMLTKSDLNEALRPLEASIQAMEVKFNALEPRFDAIDAKFDAINAKFDAMGMKIGSVHRELSGKFNILVGMMALGFTVLIGLGAYNIDSSSKASSVGETPETQQAGTGIPGKPPSRPAAAS